jgi:hypothetical protein
MAKQRRDWPPWWVWELELWDHVEERVGERPFSEVDLRCVMEEAKGYKSSP